MPASGLQTPFKGEANAVYRPLTAYQDSPISVNPTLLRRILRGSQISASGFPGNLTPNSQLPDGVIRPQPSNFPEPDHGCRQCSVTAFPLRRARFSMPWLGAAHSPAVAKARSNGNRASAASPRIVGCRRRTLVRNPPVHPERNGNRLLNRESAVDGDDLAVVKNQIGVRRREQRRRAEKNRDLPQHHGLVPFSTCRALPRYRLSRTGADNSNP